MQRILHLLAAFTVMSGGSLAAAPAHPHPYLMPPAEKQRLLERLRSKAGATQYEALKARADQGQLM